MADNKKKLTHKVTLMQGGTGDFYFFEEYMYLCTQMSNIQIV